MKLFAGFFAVKSFFGSKILKFSSLAGTGRNDDVIWTPDILLFSEADNFRDNLLSFARKITRLNGNAVNFDIVKESGLLDLFSPKIEIPEKFSFNKIFVSRQSCSDFFAAIKNISATFEYPGFMPDTVVVSANSQHFSPETIFNLKENLNSFGKNLLSVSFPQSEINTIDIWFENDDFKGFFSLFIAKYLKKISINQKTKFRILVYKNIEESDKLLKNYINESAKISGIKAEIIFTGNETDFAQTVAINSQNTDLSILHFPKKISEYSSVCEIAKMLKNYVFVNVSQKFINYGYSRKQTVILPGKAQKINAIAQAVFEFELGCENLETKAKENLNEIKSEFDNLNERFSQMYSAEFLSFPAFSFDKINSDINNFLSGQNKNLSAEIVSLSEQICFHTENYLKFLNNSLKQKSDLLKAAINYYKIETEKILQKVPLNLYFFTKSTEQISDIKLTKLLKNKAYTINDDGRPHIFKIQYNNFLRSFLPLNIYKNLYEISNELIRNRTKEIISRQNIFSDFFAAATDFSVKIAEENLSNENIEKFKTFLAKFSSLLTDSFEINFDIKKYLTEINEQLFKEIESEFAEISLNKLYYRIKNYNKQLIEFSENLGIIHEIYLQNADLHFASWENDNKFNKFRLKLIFYNAEIKNIYKNKVSVNYTDNIYNYKKILSNFLFESPKTFNATEISVSTNNSEIISDLKEKTEIIFAEIYNEINTFGQNSKLFTSEFFEKFYNLLLEKPDEKDVKIYELLKLITENEYFEPINVQTEVSLEKISAIYEKSLNVLRLMSYIHFDSNGKRLKPDDESFFDFVKTSVQNLDEIMNETESEVNMQMLQISNQFERILKYFNTYEIIRYSENYFKKIQYLKNNKFYISVKEFIIKNSLAVKNYANSLPYKQSEILILKSKLQKKLAGKQNSIEEISDFVKNYTVSEEVYSKLPYFYKELYLRENNHNPDFYLDRKQESEQFAKAADKFYKHGSTGCILIISEKYEGKSFFIKQACKSYLPSAKIYYVNPQKGGNSEVKHFKKALSESLGISGDYEKIFKSVLSGSVIVFENIHLWFTRTEKGFEVISEIKKIVNNFGSKILFIISSNTFAYKIFDLLHNFSETVTAKIELNPMNALQLRNIVMKMHSYTDFEIKYKSKKIKRLSKKKEADIFSSYFDITGGNCGVSGFLWVSGITDFYDKTIVVKKTFMPNFIGFDNLEIEYKELLRELILHEEMSAERLSEVTDRSIEFVQNKISALERMRLIEKNENEIFTVNKFVYSILVNKLRQKALI